MSLSAQLPPGTMQAIEDANAESSGCVLLLEVRVNPPGTNPNILTIDIDSGDYDVDCSCFEDAMAEIKEFIKRRMAANGTYHGPIG